MKATFTGYSQFTSYKKDPAGTELLCIGLVFNDPNWTGFCSETRFIPMSFLPLVKKLKPNSQVNVEEWKGRIADISPLD